MISVVNWTVEVEDKDDGTVTQVDKIFNVHYSRGETDRLGKAIIECADNSTNRGFSSGDSITIKKNGTEDFVGYVTGKPTSAGADPTLEIESKDSRLALKHEQVGRVFYNMDTGNIIKEALNNTTELKNQRNVFTGDDISNWSSDTPELELGNLTAQQLHEVGSDFIFVGWVEDSGAGQEVYSLTNHSVPARAIPGDGTIDRMETRFLVNNRGQHFDLEVNLRDNHGNNYNWSVDIAGSRFQTYELNAEDATTEASIGSSLSQNGSIEFRFKLEGALPEPRAAAIDYARTIPFDTSTRSTDLSDAGIDTTGRKITRRVDRSLFELITNLSTEDDYISYVDTDNVLYYEQSGQERSDLSIDYNTTHVVEATFNRDYENVVNKVTVQGDGDVRVSIEDSASIQFFGVSPREEPIVDESIQTEAEATKRGRGYLRKHAWNDSAFEFTVADVDYQSLSIGNDVFIDWPPENINGTYTVTEKETDQHGLVTLSFTDTSAV